MNPPVVERITIGATLPVPEPWRGLLASVRTGLGDPLGDVIAPHITLIPPTAIRPPDLRAFVRHARSVATRFTPFRVELDGVSSFRPVSDVVYSPLTAGASECAALAAALRAGPATVDLAYPYHPHVTLAHNRGPGALVRAKTLLNGFCAGFPLEEIVLSTSTGSAAEWTPLQRLSLNATSTAPELAGLNFPSAS
ncbi:2'-5' RNA ligase family protein [Glycomyces dulcitolivorans]|uniref:2'-5' RNA ligase family protein n=1 Tax=Glycomyces dulcitolivorans TaxID=2200759 RepID=UPI000DD2CFC5|nr:2'-5' RNA ligase family protein [Glycomyces dulcitolivorans]